MSHTHWDHICAFPFFTPVYIPVSSITIYRCHDELEARFRNQNHPYNFPVLFENMAADLTFVQPETDTAIDINGFQVTPHALHHPGDSYAYKLERDGKTFVYATDVSYNDLTPEAMGEFVDFYRGADALVFDPHFDDLIESFEKSDWGHSSSFIGVDIALNAKVRRLILFHHDHLSDDSRLIDSTHNYLNHVAHPETCQVILGCEGLVLDL
ncbi:MAG: hypothetical protein CME26_09930 [Gemmatimonadetes bacterium]|nr:hypothetical protein [Gemmatimonadota bacterium]|tara:strand:+ start:1119 stop:1751 length:633 start_codon:yes stop_codon:yes gene_type:complete